jgi:uncharacterized protein HemY
MQSRVKYNNNNNIIIIIIIIIIVLLLFYILNFNFVVEFFSVNSSNLRLNTWTKLQRKLRNGG